MSGLADRSRAVAPKLLRCAIYTRKSTEYGLEQEFNSLDNQREAAEAYVKSQAHEGWRLLPTTYDDGGFSGGSLERPALRRLLAEVEAERIDVIVVYKVDRLTRSLADFAKLVELFDRHATSFVSVTQAFNTTNSMGRLTLNVLLSFAQFEREVTGERIRDKIAASKRKGMRVGGPVPLGYEVRDKKLVPCPAEAEQVRFIFRRYLDLGSLTALMADLDARGMVTKASPRRDGSVRGGLRFGKGGLAALLRNRCYIGEVVHKGRHYPGEHAPIVDAGLFDAVQAALRAGARREGRPNRIAGALLKGLIFDDRGNRMTPSTANKRSARYRYYVSCCLAQGRKGEAGSRSRVPALEIEALVLKALGHGGGGSADEIAGGQSVLPFRSHAASPADDSSARTHGPVAEAGPSRLDGPALPSDETAVHDLATRLEKVIVEADRIVIVPRPSADGEAPRPIAVPWPAAPRRRRRGILHAPDAVELRPIRAETRARLVQNIADARAWLAELASGRVADTKAIALREGFSDRHVRTTLNLAFLAPDIVEAAIEGTLPDGLGVVRLCDVGPDWKEQRTALDPRLRLTRGSG